MHKNMHFDRVIFLAAPFEGREKRTIATLLSNLAALLFKKLQLVSVAGS